MKTIVSKIVFLASIFVLQNSAFAAGEGGSSAGGITLQSAQALHAAAVQTTAVQTSQSHQTSNAKINATAANARLPASEVSPK